MNKENIIALLKSMGLPEPTAYQLPDDNWILEWQVESGVIVRLEIETPTNLELMVTYPLEEKTKAVFLSIKPST
jgi:hypothetical protein